MASQSDTARAVRHGLDFGLNEWVVDEQRERYLHDPSSVDQTWRDFFAAPVSPAVVASSAAPERSEQAALKAVRVAALIHAYRVRGHLMAGTDPLMSRLAAAHPELDIAAFGLHDADRAENFVVDGFAGHATMTLDEVLGALREFYCGTAGFEYMHIQDSHERRWIQQRVEGPRRRPDRAEQLRILYRLGAAEAFETFLQTKYVGQKRYSLEGGESAIVLLDALLLRAIEDRVGEAVIGMAHRGRLNVLANIIGKSYAQIFDEFEDAVDIRSVQGSGDVKYHLGAEGTYRALDGGTIAVSVVANPSHLEIVGPVAQGVVRAKQDLAADRGEPRAVLPVLVHGDAAFAGQGVVAETLNMSQLAGYRTDGTVHVVVNNQVGFTTLPANGRSSTYATDVARMVEAPIFHVNGDDPEAVDRVARLAFDYRRTFHKDVVVDLVCYRRHGHSEVDDPSITQPLMYERIAAKASVRTQYAEALVHRGDIDERQVAGARRNYRDHLERAFAETRTLPAPRPAEDVPDTDAGQGAARLVATAIDEATARQVIASQTDLPRGFTVHPRVLPQLHRRTATLDTGTIDWATAETLAIGSLLLEGVPVRLAGQDSRRGTFGQRHAVLTDRRTGAEHTPLNSLGPRSASFAPFDSMLSELAALAFEYGYALARPEALVLWEAQFGDFVNGAQTVIDEYIASSEQKWGRRSAVTLLLPHGLEGQGPDHSSARIERFLQLCAQGNMTVALPSLPGNYFHLLRQQALDGRGRPLVVFTPKSMLRSKAATSALAEFTRGGFRPILPDDTVDPVRVERVLLCSGKVFHDLDAHRHDSGSADTAIVRVERLYPFPEGELAAELARFPAAADVRWVQEEPENQGAWSFVAPRLYRLAGRPVACVSRPEAPAPAVGSARRHALEQTALVTSAFQ
ncbi:Multifunctional 2-oxoglutarate metabolism enzyme [Streptomyces sp. RB17]|uniref:multifunctional oxoglutarate decarboxylase/oxoglutarate dehydrogenase thiamine pyrophosphate-binding subunit/dihydrolipoyllysine-residue succinyltransferase subunit n=1 Tax=Streptomyces sp. RB17 TaxID=2585197 RepID=UPI0012956296|nr:multifunctional oxoglutarate decarboxylase/oxoglutarate dehydrogenase thiamine pyrophosphate-binding subunit/dihydrolipoyllysine-residue succinyltransferase subunit [Streptomyces sp. RB17]MQY33784.1 Multifunctional 2-oxoglutarate metabolism enzyme [Streptomyces sp. RB17]